MRANGAKNAQSWRDAIKVHPACKLFPVMSGDELRELGEDIKKNGMTTPIIIWAEPSPDPEHNWFARDYYLLDGRNRLEAMEAVGISFTLSQESGKNGDNWHWVFPFDEDRELSYLMQPPHVIRQSRRDPCDWVLSANIHRRHLKPEDRIRLVEQLTKLRPELSSRQIALKAHVSPTTAAKVRKELEAAGDVSTLDTLTDTQGRQQPAHKPRQIETGAIAEVEGDDAGKMIDMIDMIGRLAHLADEYEPAQAINAIVKNLHNLGGSAPWPPPFSVGQVVSLMSWLARFNEDWRKVVRDHNAICREEHERWEEQRRREDAEKASESNQSDDMMEAADEVTGAL